MPLLDTMCEQLIQRLERKAQAAAQALVDCEGQWAAAIAQQIERMQAGEMVGTPEEAVEYVGTLRELANVVMRDLRKAVVESRSLVDQARTEGAYFRDRQAMLDQMGQEATARFAALSPQPGAVVAVQQQAQPPGPAPQPIRMPYTMSDMPQ